MDAPQCKLRVLQQDQSLVLRVEGRATMSQGLALRRYLERSAGRGVVTVRMDLRDCQYMDSTFLGTLLYLQRLLCGRYKGSFVLDSPSSECCRLLEQLGLADVFAIIHSDAANDHPWTLLQVGFDDASSMKQNVVEAHEELARLPGKAGEQFRAVTACIAGESHPKS